MSSPSSLLLPVDSQAHPNVGCGAGEVSRRGGPRQVGTRPHSLRQRFADSTMFWAGLPVPWCDGTVVPVPQMLQWCRHRGQMGCGSGMTCWRLRDWHEAGVWQSLHECWSARLHQADQLDWSRACIDSVSLRAVGGGKNRPQSDRSEPAGEQAPPRCCQLWWHQLPDGACSGQGNALISLPGFRRVSRRPVPLCAPVMPQDCGCPMVPMH